MNKGLFVVFSLVCLLSLTEAAPKKPKYFNLYKELVGSWNVAKTVVSISTGKIIEETVPLMFNFTKGDIQNEIIMEEVDFATKEEIRKPYQVVISAKSNFTAVVSRFEPGAENEVVDMMNIQFNEFLKEEVFVSVLYFLSFYSILLDLC